MGVAFLRRRRLAVVLLAAAMTGIAFVGCRGGGEPPSTATDLSGYPWLYEREDAPPASDDALAEVVIAGDIMLGRDVVRETDPLANMEEILQQADLAIGNLEAIVISADTERDAPRAPAGMIRLGAPLSATHLLREGGFDLLGLANNHALDWGEAALGTSVSYLRDAGIAVVGVGRTREEALTPWIGDVNGVRIAVLAFTMIPGGEGVSDGWQHATWERERAIEAVRAARAVSDAVIVLMHWGYEYDVRADPAQRRVTRALWEAGADLVVGAHPHVVQPGAVEEGRVVAYSVGNFVFDQQAGETRYGLLLRALLDREGVRGVQLLPIRAGPRPRLLAPDEAESLLARVLPALPRMGFACDREGCEATPVPQDATSGTFTTGRADFTGDGVPEEVRLSLGRIEIEEEGGQVWRGPLPWRTLDLALGDPNDDGRYEAILALEKADEEGVMRSHPFIVGKRGGQYRVLWGGSAVRDPIYEVELGDVDGDGAEELVVLDAYGDGEKRSVSVWKWHGWGYSLFWRSPPGAYQDLVLVDRGDDNPPVISVTRRNP